jgi:hypothetical protein
MRVPNDDIAIVARVNGDSSSGADVLKSMATGMSAISKWRSIPSSPPFRLGIHQAAESTHKPMNQLKETAKQGFVCRCFTFQVHVSIMSQNMLLGTL